MLCIDGRSGRCLVEWLTVHFGIDYVDLITEPGADGLLAQDPDGPRAAGIRSRLAVSLAAHQPSAIVIAGHDDCAVNPVEPAIHRAQERRAVAVLRGWYEELPVLGLHVDSQCGIHVVDDEDSREPD